LKKVFTGIVAVLLVAALAIPAFAATLSDSQKDQINNLYDQMANLRKQLVQKYVDAGELTKDEAAQINENIDNATKYQKENSGQPGYGAGYGCGGYGGAGMMGGSGYGMMGGYGGSGNARNVAPTI
jgi:predicted PurR-regulated permease PerM